VSTSVIPAARARLLELLQADARLAGVQVVDSFPGDAVEQEVICFAGGGTGRHEVRALAGPRQHRDENFTLVVLIEVDGQGSTRLEVEARIFALFAVVEDVVAANPNLSSLPGIYGATVGAFEFDSGRTDVGAAGYLRADIDVAARLT
jgi:hypothetical protein